MEVNILGLIAVLLFVLIPTSFLLILYVKTASAEVQKLTFLFGKINYLDSI
jgi:photosystem II reaction center protein PsbM